MENAVPVETTHRKLLLVGGCELHQLSNFCKLHNIDFVNLMNIRSSRGNVLPSGKTGIRYDDPSFFTADREALRDNEPVKRLSGWTHKDALLLDENIRQADVIILAMRAVLRHYYVVTRDKIYIRIRSESLKFYLDNEPDWFKINFQVAELNTDNRLDLIAAAFELLKAKAREDAAIFILGDNARTEFNIPELSASVSYNNFCRNFCRNNPGKFNFIDISTVVRESSLIDGQPKMALNSNVRVFASSVRLAVLLRAQTWPARAEADSSKNSANSGRSSPL